MVAKIVVVGANGQISIGKKHAGETLLIDQVGKSSWRIEGGKFIPDSEKWLYADPVTLVKLDKALDWAEKNKPVDNFDVLIKEFERAANKNRSK